MKRFCVDTNIIFSFQKDIAIGDSPTQVITNLSVVILTGELEVHLTPAISDELQTMYAGDVSALKRFLSLAHIQSPPSHAMSVGAGLMIELLSETRKRNYQALKVSEEVVVEAAHAFMGKEPLERVPFQKAMSPLIEHLRTRFRNATRTGTIDSVADLELILLCKSEGLTLVTADEGLLVWARKMGVSEISLPSFGEYVRSKMQS